MTCAEEDKRGEKVVVSVVIGSFNRRRFLRMAIESVRQELTRCPFPGEIIVVDGGSTDGSLPWLLKQKDILTIVQHNRGEWQGRPIERRSWGYFMNLGFRCAQGKYICMLSDDCLVVPGAIENGCRLFDEKVASGEQVGAVAFFWRNWPEDKKYSVGYTPGQRYFVNHGLFLRSAVANVGYIDENTYHFYHADTDLCLRLWAADFVCVFSENSFIEHYSHANTVIRKSNLATQKNDYDMYLQRWGLLAKDANGSVGGWVEVEHIDVTKTVKKFITFDKIRRIKLYLQRGRM